MKRFLKLLKWLFIAILFIVIVLISVAELSEDFIVKEVLNQVKDQLKTENKIEDVNFSFISRFPYATLEFKGTEIISHENGGDTLVKADKMYVSLNSTALLNNEVLIERLELVGGRCNYTVNSKGVSNFDFLLPKTTDSTAVDTTSSAFYKIELKKLLIKDLNFYYNDSVNRASAHLTLSNTEAMVRLYPDDYTAKLEGEAVLNQCSFGDTNLDKMKESRLNYDIALVDGMLSLNRLNLTSDGVAVATHANIDFKQRGKTDFTLESCKMNITELKKYIPQKVLKAYGVEHLKGEVLVSGDAKAVLADTAWQSANLILAATTPQSNMNGSLNLKNDKRLSYKLKVDSEVSLDEVASYLPDTLFTTLGGKVMASTQVAGRVSNVEQLYDVEYLLSKVKLNVVLDSVDVGMKDLIQCNDISGAMKYGKRCFNIDSLSLELPEYGVALDKSNIYGSFSGDIDSLHQMSLVLDKVELFTPQSKIEANVEVQNLLKPNYKADATVKVVLDEFAHFVPDSMVSKLSGVVEGSVHSEATVCLDSIDAQMFDIACNRTVYDVSCRGVDVEMVSPAAVVHNLSTRVAVVKDTILVGRTSARVEGIGCYADTCVVSNYYNTLLDGKNEMLSVEGVFAIDSLNYTKVEELMAKYMPEDTTVAAEAESSNDPLGFSYQIKGRASAKNFGYGKAQLNDMSMLFNVNEERYIIDQFHVNAFDGSAVGSLKYIIDSPNRQLIKMHASTNNVDIRRFLADFDNFEEFGQDYIKSEQLSGQFTSDVNAQFLMKGDSLVIDSTLMRGDLMLTHGGLYNYDMATEMSKYTNIDQLDNMKFDTIRSNIFIMHGASFVPKTDIKSNALNIVAYGMQSFGDDYEYQLQLFLGEILYGKTERIRKLQAKQKDKPNGGTRGLKTLFLFARHAEGKDKMGLATRKGRRKIQTKISLQEMGLDVIFHPKLTKFDTNVNF